MAKLAAPMIARAGRLSSPFNEGISVSQADWAREAKANPALNSKDRQERSEAIRKEVLGGSLKKYRRR